MRVPPVDRVQRGHLTIIVQKFAKWAPVRREKMRQDREDGWVPALPGCHTQARSLDALMERIREAIALNLEDRGAFD